MKRFGVLRSFHADAFYLATSKNLYCIGKEDSVCGVRSVAPKPAESPRSEDETVAHIQIAPVEAMLAPSQTTPYQVRAYNKKGQFLKVVSAEFTTEGGGTVTPEGRLHGTDCCRTRCRNRDRQSRRLDQHSTPANHSTAALENSIFLTRKVPPTWIGAAYRSSA